MICGFGNIFAEDGQTGSYRRAGDKDMAIRLGEDSFNFRLSEMIRFGEIEPPEQEGGNDSAECNNEERGVQIPFKGGFQCDG